MGYDSWENVGYKVIETLNSYDVLLHEIREDIIDIKTTQSTLQTKMWMIGIVASTAMAAMVKFI